MNMLYLIVAASLIYISNAQCTTSTVADDCKEYIDQVANAGYQNMISIVCDTRGDGTCTIACPGTISCGMVAPYVGMDANDVTCSGGYCAVATSRPTQAPVPTPAPVPTTATPTQSPVPTAAADPCTAFTTITEPVSCTSDTECDEIFNCIKQGTSEGGKCIDNPISDGKMCSASCTTDGQTICDDVNTALAMPGGVVLQCISETGGGGGKVCQAKLDRSCTTDDDCEDKLAATVNKVGQDLIGSTLVTVTPTLISQSYKCVANECTITCNDDPPIKLGDTELTGEVLCGYVQTEINNNVVEQITLECDYADNTDKACIDEGTGVEPVTTTAVTTTDELDCDDDPCGEIQRPECIVDPDFEIDGKCSVRVEFDIDVCIINEFMKRYDIIGDIRDACIQFTGSAQSVCSGGVWYVDAYECYKENGAEFDFYSRPQHKDDCPGVKGNGQCININNNGNGAGGDGTFGANIKGSAGLYCSCGNDATAALENAKAKIIENANAKLDFATECLGASVFDDAICEEGFGVVEANILKVTFRDGDGNEVVEGIDITGGAMKMCYYMVSVVVLVVVSFL